ncbi:hypothetical protein AVEN_244246-1 [Araneus ventricosus]|uniref:Uncharacterized protein n=1 Tax=Araneus ventricosus TaxID=182803 RepID=A0A4Y2Q0V0_ARAVE|nr:hypothetical protein AVEN_203894-1 [Araneus ventricosus]GBN56763.1 hypothetical protein AVEN_244246-1 [Araneus ventricosus]
MILATAGELADAWRFFLPLRVAFCRHAPDGFRPWQEEMILSVRHENSARQVVSLTAVAIETGSPRRNPFRAGRSLLHWRAYLQFGRNVQFLQNREDDGSTTVSTATNWRQEQNKTAIFARFLLFDMDLP